MLEDESGERVGGELESVRGASATGNVIIIDTENTTRKTYPYLHRMAAASLSLSLSLSVLTAVFQVDLR